MRKSVRVINLPRTTHRQFARALALSGQGSQAAWLATQIRRFVREQQERFGEDLFEALTAEEKDLLGIVESGAAEIQHIVEESGISERRVRALLEDLVERGIVETRKKGGKTDQARGAVITLYFPKGAP